MSLLRHLSGLLFVFILCHLAKGQYTPGVLFIEERSFNDSLADILHAAALDAVYDAGEDGPLPVSFVVIDLNGPAPVFGGVNSNTFIYPASVYKMYVAMEVLKQVSEDRYSLYLPVGVRWPNDVDLSSEIAWDPRPLLHDGDTVTVDYLLDLMITRSDNTAANCLIDLAGRKSINQTMHQNGWYGSEVTRKFLPRKNEDPGYDTIRGTVTNAFHAADFMYRIYTHQLVNPWVSMQMKLLLGRQLDTTKLAAGLPSKVVFYHKTGWWNYFTGDVGIVDDGHTRYIISLLTPAPDGEARPKMKILSQRVYQLIQNRHRKS